MKAAVRSGKESKRNVGRKVVLSYEFFIEPIYYYSRHLDILLFLCCFDNDYSVFHNSFIIHQKNSSFFLNCIINAEFVSLDLILFRIPIQLLTHVYNVIKFLEDIFIPKSKVFVIGVNLRCFKE